MKAKLTRKNIEEYVPKTLFKGKCENFQLQHVMAEIEELERLAEIGRATEKVFEKGFLVHDHFYQLPDTESLLNWYRAKE